MEIYHTCWEIRSLLQTVNIIREKCETKRGARFTPSTIWQSHLARRMISQILIRKPLVNGLFRWVMMGDLSALGNGREHEICWTGLLRSIIWPIKNKCFIIWTDVYCSICGKRLRVLPQSNRWLYGKIRFKFAYLGEGAKERIFKGIEGVTRDEFVFHALFHLQEEHSDYYWKFLKSRVFSMICTDQCEKKD